MAAPTIVGRAALSVSSSPGACSNTAPVIIHVARAASPTPMTMAAVSAPNNGIRGLRRRTIVTHVRMPRRRVWTGRNAHASKPPMMRAATAPARTRTGSRPATDAADCRDTAGRPRAQTTAHPAATAPATTITAATATGVFRISRGRRSAGSAWICGFSCWSSRLGRAISSMASATRCGMNTSSHLTGAGHSPKSARLRTGLPRWSSVKRHDHRRTGSVP
jgi:hypothetical protein